MKPEDVRGLDHGLYIIIWKSGGSSLAAVGSDWKGDRWFAATNWVDKEVCFDWERVDSVRGIMAG